MMDNSRWHRFNDKAYALFGGRKPLRVMDIGCSGGGFVKDCIDDGHLAVGLEGSDYSLIRKRAEWATIPDNLFTCDATEPFQVLENGEPAKFDLITSWEMLEHLPQERLPQFFANVTRHLSADGLFIASVSTQQGFHHVCVMPEHWWLEQLKNGGLFHQNEYRGHFGDDWIRGPRQNAPDSFHVICKLGA